MAARFLRRLSSFSRLILFDKRGVGLSDRVISVPTLEERMEDVRAVMEAAGSQRAAVLGVSDGGPMSALFAATYPARTSALILFDAVVKWIADDEFPWAYTPESYQRTVEAMVQKWGHPDSISVPRLAPSLADDRQFREWWARYERQVWHARGVRYSQAHEH